MPPAGVGYAAGSSAFAASPDDDSDSNSIGTPAIVALSALAALMLISLFAVYAHTDAHALAI